MKLEDQFFTLDAVREAIFQRQFNEKPRNYIGASQIGAECDRQTWYVGRGEAGEPWPVETLLKFEDGHRTENLMAERLRLAGVTVTGQQDGFDLGFLKGHVDGIVTGLKESSKPHVWECKCTAEKELKKLRRAIEVHGEKNALRYWHSGYYAQAVVYMECMGYDRHFLTVLSPGGRDMESIRTNANPVYAKQLINKARDIAQSVEPPHKISQRPDYWQCKMCRFRKVCHEA